MTILKHHRENLEKLRDYLRSLPEDYKHFDMNEYFRQGDRVLLRLQPHAEKTFEILSSTPCNTVACVVGHGPSAGIPITNEDTWTQYIVKNFLPIYQCLYTSRKIWGYLFAAAWGKYEPHHYQAADRIDTYLKFDGDVASLPVPWED